VPLVAKGSVLEQAEEENRGEANPGVAGNGF